MDDNDKRKEDHLRRGTIRDPSPHLRDWPASSTPFTKSTRDPQATRGESHRFRTEFSGRSTRQRCHAAKQRGLLIPNRIRRTPRGSAATHRKLPEARRSRPEFRGRSTCQCCQAPNTTKGSSFAPRISRTIHAPASRRAGDTERVVIRAENFKDAPRESAVLSHPPKTPRGSSFASETTGRGHRKGRHSRREFFEDAPRASVTTGRGQRGSLFALRISRTLRASAILSMRSVPPTLPVLEED